MEHIVEVLQFFKQFELVSYFTFALCNMEGPNVTRGKFASNMKPLHSFERCNAKVNEIAFREVHITAPMISIAFLARLGRSETITDQLNLIFSCTERIRSKDFPVSGFSPVEGCTARASIKKLERGHTNTCLVVVVVGKLGIG